MLSWVILLISYLFINKILFFQHDRPSNLIIYTLYLISFVPFTVGVHMGSFSDGMIIGFCLYWLILIIFQRLMLKLSIKRVSGFSIQSIVLDDKVLKYYGLFSALIILYISAIYTGFRFHLTLDDVYELRMQAREYNIPTLISYLFAWSRAINPFLFGYCLVKKQKKMAAFYFLIQALSFGIDGVRSTFFMPLFVMAAIFLYKRKASAYQLKKFIIQGLLILVAISILEFLILDTFSIASLFVRRVMFVPHLLHECYYDFFLTHEPDYFRSSFLRHFGFISPYVNGITFTIGEVYFGNAAANANNGLFSDAIANLGNFGIIIMPILIVLTLRLFDRSALGIDKRIIFSLLIWYSYAINNTLFFTVLFTHGLLILIILMSFIKPEKIKQQNFHKASKIIN